MKINLRVGCSKESRSKTHTVYIGIDVSWANYISPANIGNYIFLLCEEEEGNVLFNDTLNTFYLWLYGVRHGKGPLG